MAQISRLVCITLTILALATTAAAQRRPRPATPQCGDVIGFQVLLARQGFSPGVIDGLAGKNLERALAAFQRARGLTATGNLDCATWDALGGDAAGPTVVPYRITSADAGGPFSIEIPASLPEQAALPSLDYTSLTEALAERFHTSPALLARLNPAVDIVANAEIQVPAVEPFDPRKPKPQADPLARDVTVVVARNESSVRVSRSDGTLVFFAPVTTGSEHDPLPVGDWKVRGVSWMPPFHYNPDLFWDAKPTDSKATLKPGPNSPVGVVWIDLDVEHYGIHGTPEPMRVGRAESHGCVRLTNWDAAKLAALVGPGTKVQFR
jgi:lipoprotein-anchoring transpeptidase ErfK/SrfK